MADWECHSCYKSFPTFNRVAQHMNDTNHWDSDKVCNTCRKKFFYQDDIDDHYDETGHEFYCKSCERSFQNQNNLNMVLSTRLINWKSFLLTRYAASQLSHSSQQ